MPGPRSNDVPNSLPNSQNKHELLLINSQGQNVKTKMICLLYRPKSTKKPFNFVVYVSKRENVDFTKPDN